MSKKPIIMITYKSQILHLIPAITTLFFAQVGHANNAEEIETKLTQSNPQSSVIHHQQTIKNIEQGITIQQSGQIAQQSAADEVSNDTGVISINENWTTEQIYEQIEQNPAAFEGLILQSIVQTNIAALKVLLPAYERYPQKDQSAIDWGNAMIALQEGDTEKAVNLYRKINAALPDIRLVRLQLASALYQNKQTNAAKNELEKLLREDLPEKDRDEITAYLDALKKLDKWNYNFKFSFVRDSNLENAPKVGARLGDDNYNFTYTTPHEKGTGVNYGLGVNKRWSYDNKFFTSFLTDVDGIYYWDNKKFNEASVSVNVGVGYQNSTTELELSPIFSHSWYGGGASNDNDDSLKSYTSSKGLRFSASKWLNPNIMYQNSTQFIDLSYKSPYEHNDGDFYFLSNGFLYAPNAQQYYGLYWNLSKKDGVRESDSYESSGISLSWNNTWGKGFSTLANLGITSKKYEEANYTGIKRHNREYNVGLSIWKRDFSLLGLTPRLHLSAKRTNSNSPFDETSEANATVMFTKTF